MFKDIFKKNIVLKLSGLVELCFSSIYSAIIKGVEFCLRHKRYLLMFGGIFVVVLLSCVALFVLQDFPNSADEYVFIYQAKTFLAGRLWNKPHPFQDSFHFKWIIEKENKVFGQYLPGWPLILTLAMLLKIPLYMVNPILGMLSLFALFLLGRKLYDEKIALLSVFVAGSSSFFIFNSASYFSHTACSLFLLLFVYHSVCLADSEKTYNALLAGFFFSFVFLIRPGTAFLCGLPVLFYLLFRFRRNPRILAKLFGGVLPGAIFLLFYNYKLTGDAFLMPPMLVPSNQVWVVGIAQIKRTMAYFKEFMDWTPFFILVIYFIYLPRHLKSQPRNIIALLFLIVVVGCSFYGKDGGNRYGPRYYYSSSFFLYLCAVSQLFKEKHLSQKGILGKLLFCLFVISLIVSIPATIKHIHKERDVIFERRDLYRLVESEKIKNSVIFIKSGTGTIRFMFNYDLTRNDLDYTNSVLYALDLKEENKLLMDYYPERDFYLYTYDSGPSRGYLTSYD